MPNLMPISTAPRDGTFVLLACPSGYSSTPLRFTEGQWSADRGAWVDRAYDRVTDAGDPPKYWMQTPTEPQASSPADWLAHTTLVANSSYGALLRLPGGRQIRLLELGEGGLRWTSPADNELLCSALVSTLRSRYRDAAFEQAVREARETWIETEREAGNLPIDGEDFVTPFDQFLY